MIILIQGFWSILSITRINLMLTRKIILFNCSKDGELHFNFFNNFKNNKHNFHLIKVIYICTLRHVIKYIWQSFSFVCIFKAIFDFIRYNLRI